MTKLFKLMIVQLLKLHYIVKVSLYKVIVGRYAPADVLHNSLRPEIVLSLYGAKIGKNVRIHPLLSLAIKSDFSDLTIDDDVYIGRNVFIDLAGKVTIGKRVIIGMNSRIYSHMSQAGSFLEEIYKSEKGNAIIPDDTVIGPNATILFPFSFAKKTYIAPGSVVHGHYSKSCMLIGNPARPTLYPRALKEDKLESIENESD
jgi:acetyltransferase-like isoleucine patch superfamily enzyme